MINDDFSEKNKSRATRLHNSEKARASRGLAKKVKAKRVVRLARDCQQLRAAGKPTAAKVLQEKIRKIVT